jgi:hypothetical protein
MKYSRESPVARRRILVVFDDAPMRASIATALGPRSHLLETRSPTGALDLLMATGNYLDVVIATCLASRDRPHYSSRIGVVEAMFHRFPWIPVSMASLEKNAWKDNCEYEAQLKRAGSQPWRR